MSTRPAWLPETRDFIALIMVSAMVGLLFALVLRPAAVPDNAVTNMVIGGFMTVGFTSVMAFYFGSSKGSIAKDDTINALTAGPPSTTTTTVTTGPEVPRQMPAPPRPMPVPPPGAPPRA